MHADSSQCPRSQDCVEISEENTRGNDTLWESENAMSVELEAGFEDSNLVDWSGPDDPENPQNFTLLRKWTITMSLSSMTIWITFSTSIFSTATRAAAEAYHISDEVAMLGTALPMCGFAIGPLFWGPLSELFGRRYPIFFGYAIFTVFQIPVAVAQNIQTILVSRFFIGFFGCSALAVTGGALADLWNLVDRGVAIAIFSSATFGGAVLGPIIGSFITQSYLGWRWTAWVTLIPSSSFGAICLAIVPETYHPVLLQRRAARLRRETGNQAFYSRLGQNPPSLKDIGSKYLFRPVRMLFSEPILACLTLYLEVRGWKSQGVAALPFLGILIGVFCGAGLIAYMTKTSFARKFKTHGRVAPEERLVPMIVGSILLPAGLFWFGWTSHPKISWVPQVLAGIPIGAGILVIFMQGLNYIIDVYMMFANSALAGNTMVRSAVAAGFPLFAVQMYHTALG